MTAYSLVAEPWIPVLTDTGMETRALNTVFEDDVIDIATGDALEDAAVLRLLLAITIAADAENQTRSDWLHTHHDDFDLFHPSRPFAQNADMHRFTDTPGADRPIINASYALAGSGSTAVNEFHNLSGVPFSPAAAARLVLVRQAFSVGGIQAFQGGLYPPQPSIVDPPPGKKRAEVSVLSAPTAICTNRAFTWIDLGRLNATLQVNADLAAAASNARVGQFHFTWPDGGLPPVYGTPEGVLDALTWPSRSIYLVPAEPVEWIMICDGMRWPEVGKNPGWTSEDEAAMIPHAVYERKKKSAPLTIQGVHTERAPWRQLLAALASEQPSGSVIDYARTTELPAGARLRIAGLGSYQARIDGPVDGTFPVPAPGVDPAALAEMVTAAFTTHGSYFGSLVASAGDLTAPSRAGRLSSYPTLPSQLGPVIAAAARGEITIDDAATRVTAIVDGDNARAVDQLRRTDPAAAGAVVARKNYDRTTPRKAKRSKENV